VVFSVSANACSTRSKKASRIALSATPWPTSGAPSAGAPAFAPPATPRRLTLQPRALHHLRRKPHPHLLQHILRRMRVAQQSITNAPSRCRSPINSAAARWMASDSMLICPTYVRRRHETRTFYFRRDGKRGITLAFRLRNRLTSSDMTGFEPSTIRRCPHWAASAGHSSRQKNKHRRLSVVRRHLVVPISQRGCAHARISQPDAGDPAAVPTGRLWIGRSHTGNRPMTHLLSVGRFEPSAANAQLFHQGEESREARTSGRILPQVGQIALRISPGFTPSSAGPHKPHKTK